jgi:hypothetical protein
MVMLSDTVKLLPIPVTSALARPHDPLDAGQIPLDTNVSESILLPKHIHHRLGLLPPDFKHHQTSGRQDTWTHHNEAPNQIEPILSATQGDSGFIGSDVTR